MPTVPWYLRAVPPPETEFEPSQSPRQPGEDDEPLWVPEGAQARFEREEAKVKELPTYPTDEQLLPCRRILVKPPEPEWIIDRIWKRGSLALMVAAGGTGKSMFLAQKAVAMAEGRPWGPFRFTRPLSVLYLGCEDPLDELDERLWAITGGRFPERLRAYSFEGQMEPIMGLDDGNPVVTPWWEWLKGLILSIPGLDVVILDPLSRFYGLDENRNEHATAFVSALERLKRETGVTMEVAHHTSKALAGVLSQGASRGASALVDGFRLVFAMAPMSHEDAQVYDLDARSHVEVDIVKTNYGTRFPSRVFFERGERGVLTPVNPEASITQQMALRLAELLRARGGGHSRRDLARGAGGGAVVLAALKLEFPKRVSRDSVENLIDYGLKEGILVMKPAFVGPNSQGKMVVCPS